MHLTELIDSNICIAVTAERKTVGDKIDKIRIGAVKFRGWIVPEGKIKDRVNIYDGYSFEFCTGSNYHKIPCRQDYNDEIAVAYNDIVSKLLEFKEYVGNGIVVAYDAKATIGFFDFIKVNYGVTFENRVLGIADIALVNYRDKIKDYSFDALLTRFCPVSEREKETGNAEIVARIFERLALEDDFAHCGY